MQKLVNHIISYLDYLQENCRLSITLHDFQRITSPHLVQFYQKECLLYGETPSQASNRDIILNRILLYIERNFHRQICMEDICSIFHCSRSYVGHMFKSATGYPLREYINLMHIKESRNLLRNTSLSITDIALRTGFSNSNYFTSVFHRQTGKNPTKYRRIQPDTDRHSSAFG